MKHLRSALIPIIAALAFIPAAVEASTAISTLSGATAANSFDNGNYTQTWKWNTLAGLGLVLSSSSTVSTNNSDLLDVSLLGAASTSGVTTYGEDIDVNVSGTSSRRTSD
jgi:hypothetical protein